MKIIVAPDSFKGSISSADACKAIKQSILECIPQAEVICIPIADGGEGTLDALVPSVDQKKIKVSGPLFERISAKYGVM